MSYDSLLTGGLSSIGSSGSFDQTSLLPGGYTIPNPSTTLNSAETPTIPSPQQYSSSLLATMDSQVLKSANSTTVQLYDSKGNLLNASQYPFWQNIQMNMGGSSFTFDPSTGQSIAGSGISLVNQAAKILDNTTVTFAGADMRILLEVNDAALPYASNLRMAKELVECTTITVSVYREKTPVRACSYINPKGVHACPPTSSMILNPLPAIDVPFSLCLIWSASV